ncbi:MAG: hypothetical protein AAF125_18465 [Chloroflexota bacterium]
MHHASAPNPDLRIIPVDAPKPHEEHDTQRSAPLIDKLRHAEIITNPPVVTQVENGDYIILDGANRCYSFAQIGAPNLMVQVVSYFSDQVELGTWNHVVSRWNVDELIRQTERLHDIQLHDGHHRDAIAHVYMPTGGVKALLVPVQTVRERNAALREFVNIYQRNAVLSRTPLNEPDDVWHLYSEANALVIFPPYEPSDIIEAAQHQAFLPPGISRHIVHGRALQVNYPMQTLYDETTSLEEKNDRLNAWITDKLMNRSIRYYAEATYQFNE